jgi:hypothetical protein
MDKYETQKSLEKLINFHGVDAYLNIPDHVLADFFMNTIETLRQTKAWWGPGEPDYDDSMDGDNASALASAGHGTDEDYGSYSEHI